jgi:hypothetical protein
MPGVSSENFYLNSVGASLIYAGTITYPTLAANVSGTNTATIAGVQVGDFVFSQMTAPPAHIFLENTYVSAANTLTFSWTTDGTGVTGGTQPITFIVIRPDRPVSQLPTGMG